MKPPTVVCKHCGKRLVPKKNWQKFCSEKCRVDNHYLKRKGRPRDMSKRHHEYW